MSKKRKKKKPGQNAATPLGSLPKAKWLPLIAFAAVGILIFYPPYFRGLFFKEEMFITHIITALVFVLVWAEKIRRRDYTLIQTPLDWAMLAYAGAYLLSLFGAVHIGEAVYGFLKALNYFMVYWLVSQVVKDYRDYENILRVLLAAGVGVAVIGVLAAVGYSDYPSAFNGRQIMSTLQYPNTTAAYLAVISLIGLTLWIRERYFTMKIIYGLSTYLAILVVLAAVSKGAWLIFIAGALLLLLGMPGIYRLKSLYSLGLAFTAAFIAAAKFVPAITGEDPASGMRFLLTGFLIVILGQVLWEAILYVHREKGPKASTIAGISLVIAVLFALILLPIGDYGIGRVIAPENIVNEVKQIGDLQNTSYVTRYDFVRWGLAIVRDHPVVGTGAGGWNALYHQYQDYLFWTTEVHNHFMQVWVEAGTVGLLAFLSMWVMSISAVYMIYRDQKKNTPQPRDNWILTWGTVAAALAFGLHAAIDFDLSLPAMAVLLWVLFALVNASFKIEKILYKNINFNPAVNTAAASILVAVMLFCGGSYAAASNFAQKADKTMQGLSQEKDPQKQHQGLAGAEKNYLKAVSLDPLNGAYHANLAQFYAVRFEQLHRSNPEKSREYQQEAVREIKTAEKLSPYDIRVRSSLLNTCGKIGYIDGMVRQARGSVNTNPNDINAYSLLAEALWKGAEHCLNTGEYDKVRDYSAQILSLPGLIEQQQARINLERPYWRGAKLSITPELKLITAKACYLQGEYAAAEEILEPFATNLLALEFEDTHFEKTEFENQNWKVSVVEDEGALNGKCVEIEAKKDMVNFPTAVVIAREIPVKPGYDYEFTLRYKVINCEDNPAGKYVHNRLAVWSHWHTENKSIPRDLIFWDGSKAKSSDGWQVYKNIDKVPKGVTHRHFYLGTGSVKAGTKYRVDYIEYKPVQGAALAGSQLEEALVWYAASLYKTGQEEKAQDAITGLQDRDAFELYTQLVKIKPLS